MYKGPSWRLQLRSFLSFPHTLQTLIFVESPSCQECAVKCLCILFNKNGALKLIKLSGDLESPKQYNSFAFKMQMWQKFKWVFFLCGKTFLILGFNFLSASAFMFSIGNMIWYDMILKINASALRLKKLKHILVYKLTKETSNS